MRTPTTNYTRSKRIIVEYARKYNILNKIPAQLEHLDRLMNLTDTNCLSNLLMNRNCFDKLCGILVDRTGLRHGMYLGVEEQVSIFLGVLAHHKKKWIVGFNFVRFGVTVSYYVNKVLGALLSLHTVLIPKPTPVPDDRVDHHWKWFKRCLEALDGTHFNVLVSNADKPRFKVQQGCCYLCNNGYANSNDFLTPYKGVRYNLREW
ncbi:hypothetical protein AAHA92_21610 [Salvia divinorum]|uniref:DUF8040 domain-containing protein n=1 Tax=Salvia divinorum TaxID=28513 RepID=A0ABD1GL09_SALDI